MSKEPPERVSIDTWVRRTLWDRELERRRSVAAAAMRRQMVGAGLAQIALICAAGAALAGLHWWLS